MKNFIINKKTIISAAICAALLLIAVPLLGGDSAVFLKWWIMALVIGAGFLPLSSRIFASFEDRGWIFSKVLGIALSGYLVFTIVSLKITGFTAVSSAVCAAVLAAACWGIHVLMAKRSGRQLKLSAGKPAVNLQLIIFEEILFIAVFLIWTYFAGFHPEAHSTEKFMDYGFMAAIMRDASLPTRDLWYSAGHINYYYGGQFFAVFLTKLTGTRVNETYNIMRTFIASFAFVMPFSITYHLAGVLKKRPAVKRRGAVPLAAGLLSGAAVSLAGNVHYILYGLFGSVFKLTGYEDYWFPSSTRYIGHNPETADACIHEFPSYSFVLGDLHAHVVNIIFVLLFIGILYAWFRKKNKRVIADPHLLIMGVLLGIFRFTNYWDFVIYLTVTVIGLVLWALRDTQTTPARIVQFAARIIITVVVPVIVSQPFMIYFKDMTGGIALSVYHSMPYQLIILWGLPAVSVIALFVLVLQRYKRRKKQDRAGGFIKTMGLSDMTALLFGICAIGLVLVPEVIYAVDIYDDGLSRCNTMFKMTYQAYILFGISMIYGIIRLICLKKKALKALGMVLLGVFALTLGYFPYAVQCWFGDVTKKEGYKGLDAAAFLYDAFPEDAQIIRWLNRNVEGVHVVLEANGESYTDFQRVSAFTGLPTVLGWFGHEWLWRSDVADIYEKAGVVKDIYTSGDEELVRQLISEYDIEYIVVGSCEREKFDDINEEMLKGMGEVVFESSSVIAPSYLIKTAVR